MTTAIILAGGLGTRLRSAVADVPKPLAPIAGRPFLAHQMAFWAAQGVQRFILSVGYRHEMISTHFGQRFGATPIDYAVEETPLGTGGGLLLAAQKLEPAGSEPVLILNGDTFFDVALPELTAFHHARQSGWTFALFRSDQDGRYMGMDVAEDGRVRALKSGNAERGCLANGGVYLVNPSLLHPSTWSPGSRLSLEDDLLAHHLQNGARLFGYEGHGRFIDIGIPADYHRAADVLGV